MTASPEAFRLVLEKERSAAALLDEDRAASGGNKGTGQAGLAGGAVLSNILYGLTDFALERAQKELLNILLDRWAADCSTDARLMMPATWQLLNDPAQRPPLSNGVVWKAAFQSDLDALPANLIPWAVDRVPQTHPLWATLLDLNAGWNAYRSQNSLLDALNMMALQFQQRGVQQRTPFHYHFMLANGFARALLRFEAGSFSIENPQRLLDMPPAEWAFFIKAVVAETFTSADLERYPLAKKLFYTTEEGIARHRAVVIQLMQELNTRTSRLPQLQGLPQTERVTLLLAEMTESILVLGDGMEAWMAERDTDQKPNSTYAQVRPILVAVQQMTRGVQLQQYGTVLTGALALLDCLGQTPAIKDDAVKQLQLKVVANFLRRYGSLAAELLMAKDADAVRKALELAAEPLGSWRIKQQTPWTLSVTLLPGISAGWEGLGNQAGDITRPGYYTAVALPVGLEYSFRLGRRDKAPTFGIFAQVLDLGALLNYRVANAFTPPAGETPAADPQIGFDQVLSPGAWLLWHVPNTPIVIGGGYSYSPRLRRVAVSGVEEAANSHRLGLLIAVDVNLFHLASSRRSSR